ncbi:MAG: aminotransferase class IV [Spirochaetia bacterium]
MDKKIVEELSMQPRHSGVYPVIYDAKYTGSEWIECYTEHPHASYDAEQALDLTQLYQQSKERNYLDIPIISGSLHYSISAFEGAKAFPQADGSVKIFRSEENAKRFQRSLDGLYIPHPGWQKINQAIRKTVTKNVKIGFYPRYDATTESRDFFGATSMYIRPFVIAESNLTPASSEKPTIMVFCLPLGSFFGSKTVTLLVSDHHRAAKGGIGWIKSAANYTMSALGRKEAQLKGYTDALFLDHAHKKYVEESSATNFMCVLHGKELVTPELGDTILAGITRNSVLTLAKDMGLSVSERLLPIDEVMADGTECFVCGTGGGVIGVSAIEHNNKVRKFGKEGQAGEVTNLLGGKLRNIQFGKEKDPYGWMQDLCQE